MTFILSFGLLYVPIQPQPLPNCLISTTFTNFKMRPGCNFCQIVNFKRTHHRRLSDPSSTINDFMRLGVLDRPSTNVFGVGKNNKCSSESDGIDFCGDATCEVFAGNLLDELEESKYNPLWTMPGYTQVIQSTFWNQFKNIIMSPFDMPTTNPIGPRYKFAQTKLFTVC